MKKVVFTDPISIDYLPIVKERIEMHNQNLAEAKELDDAAEKLEREAFALRQKANQKRMIAQMGKGELHQLTLQQYNLLGSQCAENPSGTGLIVMQNSFEYVSPEPEADPKTDQEAHQEADKDQDREPETL